MNKKNTDASACRYLKYSYYCLLSDVGSSSSVASDGEAPSGQTSD